MGKKLVQNPSKMIFVDGEPFDFQPSSSEETLFALMEHPALVSALQEFKAIPERKFLLTEESGTEKSEESNWVYLFQREYATVYPARVDAFSLSSRLNCLTNLILSILNSRGLPHKLATFLLNYLMCSSNSTERKWEYLIEHPDWRDAFPLEQPRVFER